MTSDKVWDLANRNTHLKKPDIPANATSAHFSFVENAENGGSGVGVGSVEVSFVLSSRGALSLVSC